MAVDWTLYTTRLNVDGVSDRERHINETKRRISQTIINSPSYKSNGLAILDTDDPYVKNFAALPGAVVLAGMIKNYGSSKYLVTAVDVDNEVNIRGKLEFCNYELKFLDSSGNPTSRWCCVENATKYNSGVKTVGIDTKIEIGTNQFLVKLPYDSETALINRVYSDGNDRRLLLDYGAVTPCAYKITQVDRVSYPGIVCLTLTEDTRSSDDNVTLMIADYYSRVSPTPSEPTYPACEITYLYEPVLEVGKGFKKFRSVFYDSEGATETVIPVWNVNVSEPLLAEYILSESQDDYVLLKATSELLVGRQVTLTLTNQAETVTASLILEVSSLG